MVLDELEVQQMCLIQMCLSHMRLRHIYIYIYTHNHDLGSKAFTVVCVCGSLAWAEHLNFYMGLGI
jgi:hypothetical protein